VADRPTDDATALAALNALTENRNPRGTRTVPAESFFIGPATDITRMTILQPGEILAAVRVGGEWAGKPWYFEKVSDRKSWDFALANVASVLDVQDGAVRAARIVVGGVAARPLRMRRAETSITGRRTDDPAALDLAGQRAAEGAKPLQYNAYKVALTRNLVKRAIREATV
jgi:xanthine dehydrogenase YagS FAD-binding subunit